MKLLTWIFGKKHYEIKIALATLAVLIMLPVISLVVFAGSGLALVQDTLAHLNPITHLVELFDPNGHKTGEVQLSTVWPAKGYISDEFGTWDEFRRRMHLGPHTGIDIANTKSEALPITPFMDGVVMDVHTKNDNDCGEYVRVSHKYNITSLYCHMSQPLATIGQDVKPGDVLGLEGMTGAATGVHCHFGVYVYGIAVNPRLFMVGDPEPY